MSHVERSHLMMSDRYRFDVRDCKPSDGWAQLDTRQDASYYGNWVNPIKLELVSYCEGDVTRTKCTSDLDFIQTLRECINWHKERALFIGIDPMGRPEIQSAFVQLGFGTELH